MQASGDLEAASVAGAASASAGLPSPPPGPADGSAAQPPPAPGKEEGETSEPAEATLTEYLTEADVEKLLENKEVCDLNSSGKVKCQMPSPSYFCLFVCLFGDQ